MKTISSSLFLLVISVSSYAQWAIPPQMRAANTLDNLAQNGLNQSDLLYGLPMEPGKLVGDSYITKVWNVATIMLADSEKIIEGYPVRYDIKAAVLEIKSKNGIKVLNSKNIKSMVWLDSLQLPHYFVNAESFKENGIQQSGLVEILVDGEVTLLTKFSVEIIKPNYNIAMGSGSKDTKIIPRSNFYSTQGGELTRIKSKNDVLKVSGTHSAAISKFISDRGLKVKNQYDLIDIFTHLNSLINPN